jgi:hypothetical protein
MIWEHLAGELSVRLEQLQAVTGAAADDLAQLRHQVEDAPQAKLGRELARALAVADRLCWDSLSRGDIGSFERQARVCADLRVFGACARLTDDD